MKKLVILTESWLGGVRRHVLLVAPELARRGVIVTVLASPLRFTGDFAVDQRELAGQGVTLVACPMSHDLALKDVATFCRMVSQLRQLKPDVVWAHSTKAGLLGRLAALLVGFPFGVKRFYTPHCYYRNAFGHRPIKRFFVDTYEWLLARITTGVIAISASEYADARRYGGNLVLAPNGLPSDFGARLQPRESARQQLGIQGLAVVVSVRLVPQKGLDFLIKALAQLPKPLPHGWTIHVFGEGYCESVLKQQTTAAGLADVLIWHNYRDDLATLLLAFDLAILPSRYEGLSYSLLECLAAGLPVVASDCPGNLVGNRDISPFIHYFKTSDADSLTQILKPVLEMPKPAPPQQSELVLQHFSLDAQVRILSDNLIVV
jgi:glycosyltransferase involved in cell wall biosynthesis